MGLKINLNGSNFVSERTRDAFERALQQDQQVNVIEAEANRDTDHGNGGYSTNQSVSSMDAQRPRSPIVAEPHPPQIDYQRIMESLEQGLAHSYQHQSETLRVHEQYLNNQAEYSRIFLQLMQQQGDLFAQAPSNGAAASATTRMVLESLARSIEQFHAHQNETLGMHNQFLNQQSEYARSFIDLLQEEYQTLTHTGLPAPREHSQDGPRVNPPTSTKNNSNNGHNSAPFVEGLLTETLDDPDRLATMKVMPPSVPPQHPYRAPNLSMARDRDTTASPEPPPFAHKRSAGLLTETLGLSTALSTPSPTAAAVPMVPIKDPTNGRGMSQTATAPSTDHATDVNAQTSPDIDVEALAQSLLDIVSEKTGYPTDILDLSMDMEADLGIDSIKRVEILGALEDKHPELPEVDGDALAELRTLGQIIDYMSAQGAEAAASNNVKKNA